MLKGQKLSSPTHSYYNMLTEIAFHVLTVFAIRFSLTMTILSQEHGGRQLTGLEALEEKI